MSNRRRTSFSVTLALHGVICVAICLATLEKEIHCKLQKSCYTLQSRAANCNGFKLVRAIVEKSRNELHFVQSLQAQKNCQTSCRESMLLAANYFATSLQHKLQRKFHRVTLAVELGPTFYSDCRDYVETVTSCIKRLQHDFLHCIAELRAHCF